ncbi:MAG: hypothetical protein KY475_08520 [Planctomycetes bacterium]|nr:hypothetical protein [Planctomycetota bacterium]
MTRATSVEDYKLYGSFEAVRKTLLDPKFADRRERPLAYWALPSDRRLPLAFLGRTVGDLLESPFEELCATPGIGQKKIQSLVKLLHRATKDKPPGARSAGDGDATNGSKAKGRERESISPPEGGFDPGLVSEALWVQWRETIRRLRLEHDTLGRLAPSLESLPTVIWRTPLKFYADKSLGEIRELRTHGEKRVRVVLEVFYVINAMLAEASAKDHLAIRLMPRFAADIECWLDEVHHHRETPPELGEVQERLARPILRQIEIDAGGAVFDLSAGRLKMADGPQSVRVQSRRMGVTRARIYQLLDECSKVMAVRWPDGRGKLRSLEEKVRSAGEAAEMCRAVRELCFPDKYEHRDEEAKGEG